MYFTADDGLGRALWRSDGTDDGTVKLKSFGEGGYSYGSDEDPSSLTAVGNQVFFTAGDDVHGQELWVSDGTRDGTVMVADVKPGRRPSEPLALTEMGGNLFYLLDAGFNEEDAAPIIEYFDQGGALQVADLTGTQACLKGYGSVPGLVELARTAVAEDAEVSEAANLVVASEVLLEGLVAKRKISRSVSGGYARRRERPRPPHSHGLGGVEWPHET